MKDSVLSLDVLARTAQTKVDQPRQFWVLVRHILERFFNNELMASDGEAKTRLVQMACVIGLPGFVMALYLYAPYHPPRGTRPYWGQVGDHYFYVLYSFVATGILTFFAWDFFFPDMLDVLVLSTLPFRKGRLIRARIAAVLILLMGFLLDSNFLAPLVLPAATEPPHLGRLLLAHVVAVGTSGIFAATCVLSLQGILLAVLREHGFRKVALWLQGASVAALLSILFLYTAMFGSLRTLITSQQGIEYDLPPLWFLGIYQQLLEGHATSPAFVRLAHLGWFATLLTTFLAVLFYPIAYVRKIRGLMEGIAARQEQRRKLIRIGLHATVVRSAAARAVWHFIGQTLLGVARYRFYLVMYGGVGLALLVSAVLRISIEHERLTVVFSPDGLRAALPIVAFWTVSGFRMTFMSPADQKGTWVFRVIAGKAGYKHLATARRWVVCWAAALSLAVLAIALVVMPGSYPNWRTLAAQVFVAFGLCILLTDAFFFDVKIIPFTCKSSSSTTNFALLLIPYLAFFPAIVFATVALEPWIESQSSHLIFSALVVLGIHLGMHSINKATIAEHIARAGLDGDEEDFPLRLGLR